MRVSRLIRAGVVAALGIAACGPAIDVRTAVSPDANLAVLHTFRVLPAPRPRPDIGDPAPDDPMLVNSITNRALRRALVAGFEGRGYMHSDSAPDFVIAYYAAAKHRLDVSRWDYGYPWHPEWWRVWGRRGPRRGPIVTEFTEGTIIVDVLDATAKELLWRGRGVAVVSDDVNEYLIDLHETVAAILKRFPAAQPAMVASCGGSAP